LRNSYRASSQNALAIFRTHNGLLKEKSDSKSRIFYYVSQ
jgi:hypothetical protein